MLKDASGQGATAAGPVVAVDAGSIPAPDRFGWWSGMVGHEVMTVSIRSPRSARFQGRVEAVDLPYGQVSTFSNSPMTAHRSPVRIRRQDPEEYFLILVRAVRSGWSGDAASPASTSATWPCSPPRIRELPADDRVAPAVTAVRHGIVYSKSAANR